MHQKYGDRVAFVGLPSVGTIDEFREFVAETGTGGIRHVPDIDMVVWERFDIFRHKTYVLINQDGTTQTRDYGTLETDLQSLIAN